MPKRQEKLNDKIKPKNGRKEEKYISEETKEVRRFIIILFSIIVIVLVVYAISKIFVKEPEQTNSTITAGEIDYDIVSIGTALNRPENEYYVIIYDVENTQAVLYSSIISKYSNKEKALKVYYCDLGNALNNKYYVGSEGSSNKAAQNIDELALKELTLLKVKNGKITKYIEDLDTIKSEFGI